MPGTLFYSVAGTWGGKSRAGRQQVSEESADGHRDLPMACERLTRSSLDNERTGIYLLATVAGTCCCRSLSTVVLQLLSPSFMALAAVAASVLWSFSHYHRALSSSHAYHAAAAAAAAASAAQAAAYATRTQASGSVNVHQGDRHGNGPGPGRCGLEGVARAGSPGPGRALSSLSGRPQRRRWARRAPGTPTRSRTRIQVQVRTFHTSWQVLVVGRWLGPGGPRPRPHPA